jgi:hypothetical protein
MRGNSVALFTILAVLCACCSRNPRELTGVDWEAWKNDRQGCGNIRKTYQDAIKDQKDRLKSMSEMEVVEQMGRPDQTELLKRNQKFYTYFISGGPGCAEADSSVVLLTIRFNAMGLAKEVEVGSRQ